MAGYDAAVGTVFHELIAHWQLIGARPDYLAGQTRIIKEHEIGFDDEMFTYAEECLNYYAHIPGERHVEVTVDISSLTPIPGQSGTSDLIIVNDRTIDVIDWKYGKGVKVFAKNNSQGLCYAWGAFQKFGGTFDTIRIHIAQPRLEHYDLWEIDQDTLYEFAEWARVQWAEAYSGKGRFKPSNKACQWCRAKVGCPAYQALLETIADESCEVLEEITVVPGTIQDSRPDITLTRPAQLSTERLAWLYQYRGLLERWFRLVGEELIARGLAGDDLGGMWKVGEGRLGRRTWVDEEIAAIALKRLGLNESDLWPRELASPATVEKLLRNAGIKGELNKRYIGMFTHRANGKPTLLPVNDSRMSYDEVADDTFEESH